jgi:predicted acetyltransferase
MGQDEAVNLEVRPLAADDADAARQLSFEAFGVPPTPPTEPARIDEPGRTSFGSFHDGVLVAKAVDRAYDSYFGGVAVPTAGIAGVTVAAEARGQGLLAPVLDALLRAARDRGAVVSGLFPTAPRIYRRFGYEVVTSLDTVEVPTSVLASVARPVSARTRRAVPGDFDAIRTVYDAWAVEQNGPLSRRGVSFPAGAEDFLGSYTGVTVAVDEAGSVCGYASWRRGEGFGEKAMIDVADLLATTADGYRALLSTIGSFSSVTAHTRLRVSGDDLVRSFLPTAHWRRTRTLPYMVRVVDVPTAFALRRYPPGLTADLAFRLTGDFLAENNTGYRIVVAGGRAECTITDSADPDRVLTPQGLSLAYAGAQSSANLRAAGHLTGGTAAEDQDWDAALGGRQVHIRDFY